MRSGFDARPVPDALVAKIVETGLAAPSSKNAQPWRIHVVRARDTLAELADAVQDAKHGDRYVPIDPRTGHPRRWTSTVVESAEILRSVSLGLFIENRGEFSGGRSAVAAADGEVLHSGIVGYGLEMVGIGAAIHAMWVTAEEHDVVGVFMGDVGIAEQVIAERLGLHGDLVGVLALGYSDDPPVPKSVLHDRVVWHSQD